MRDTAEWRMEIHTAISYNISFVAHSRRPWRLCEEHNSGSFRIVSPKWSFVSCGSIATTPNFSRTVRSKSLIIIFKDSSLLGAVPSGVVRAISKVASMPLLVPNSRCWEMAFKIRISLLQARAHPNGKRMWNGAKRRR